MVGWCGMRPHWQTGSVGAARYCAAGASGRRGAPRGPLGGGDGGIALACPPLSPRKPRDPGGGIMGYRRFHRPFAKALTGIATLGLVLGVLPGVLMATATSAAAATADPDGVSFTIQGCRNTGSITLPIGGKFVCPDSAYTT